MSDGGKPAFVPGFEYDVFISYAWVNNYPEQDAKPETGWVLLGAWKKGTDRSARVPRV